MFQEFVSKPIIRKAHKVTVDDTIGDTDKESTSTLTSKGIPRLFFKHYEPVNVGDYIVYLNDSDIYHCTAEVFEERNVV